MTTTSRISSFVLLGTAIVACMPNQERFVEERSFAMATWVDVVFESTGDDSADAAILHEIEAMLREYETDFYPWANGELARLNASFASAESIQVSRRMAELLRRAQSISRSADGYFEPGVGGLVELWGFHSTDAQPSDPGPQEIQRWLDTASGIAEISIDNQRVTAQNRALKLDFGGIAKGAAVDEALALLRGHGIDNALVNAGGDLRVIGSRSGRSWRIGIKSPRTDGLLGYVELESGEAAFTSGDYERYMDAGGKRAHHILDSRTGYPAYHTQAVTVIAEEGLLADAAATAIFVAGPSDWRKIAHILGIESALRVDASGDVEMTDAMSARLRPAAVDDGPTARNRS